MDLELFKDYKYSQLVGSKPDIRGWITTSRPMFGKSYDQPGELSLGINEQEVKKWKEKSILEVGPGDKARAIRQLIERGCNDIRGLEPDLLSKHGWEFAEGFDRLGVLDRMIPALARDAHLFVEEDSIDIAYAIGPNFQNYSENIREIVESIQGVVRCIKNDGQLIFELSRDSNGIPIVHYKQRAFYNRRDVNAVGDFYLPYLLDDLGIDYQLVDKDDNISIRINKSKDVERLLKDVLENLDLEERYSEAPS